MPGGEHSELRGECRKDGKGRGEKVGFSHRKPVPTGSTRFDTFSVVDDD